MDTNTFVSRAEAQPVIAVQRTVSVLGPQLQALIADRKVAFLSDIMVHPDQHKEQRVFRYKHVLERGAATSDIAAWQAEHPNHPLPEDLVAFLGRANGVHLWADIAIGRGDYGILPLSEWRDAGSVDWSVMFMEPPQGQLVLSYHDNGDYFLVLDTNEQSYYWYDLEDFDRPKLVARNVSELLTWYWQQAEELDPQLEGESGRSE
jgi:hypothetical protein